MTIVDCPLCGSAAGLSDDADALDCQACGVAIELADGPAPEAMPAAA